MGRVRPNDNDDTKRLRGYKHAKRVQTGGRRDESPVAENPILEGPICLGPQWDRKQSN